MIISKRKNKNNKISISFKAILSLVLSLMLSFLFLFVGIRASIRATENKVKSVNQVKLLKAELKELQVKKILLEKKIKQVKSSRYLEKTFRQSLNLKKKGEKIVVFPIVDSRNNRDNIVKTSVDRKKIIDEVLKNRLSPDGK